MIGHSSRISHKPASTLEHPHGARGAPFSATLLAAVVVALGCSIGSRSDAAAPVEGDPQLLQMVIAALETNNAGYRSGEMTVRAAELVNGEEVNADVIWSEDKIYYEYKLTDEFELPQGPHRGRQVVAHTGGRLIDGPGTRLFYSPEDNRAQIKTPHIAGSGFSQILRLRPTQCWFRIEGPYGQSEQHTWRYLLDPANFDESSGVRFVVRQDGSDTVVIEKHYKDGRQMVTASLAHGANIVEFETILSDAAQKRVPEPGLFWRKGHYEWAATDGIWYPRHFEYQRSSVGDPEQLAFHYVLDVSSFRPRKDIPSQQFTLAALEIQPGTVVEETGSRERTYRLGADGREKERVSQDQLDRLSDELRSDGFGQREGRSAGK